MKLKKKYLLFFLFPSVCLADPSLADPCTNLFALLNRPTVLDSPCAVKSGDAMIEAGYQFQTLYPENGQGNNFPEALLRFGLPGLNELAVLMPNYVDNHLDDADELTGSTATVVTLKHQFPIYQQKWVYAAESAFTLPAGNDAFGSDALGVTLNGIVNYDFTPDISATLMLGVSSLSASPNDGGQRYTSFNPDLVLSWQTTHNSQIYAEVYGQTKTYPNEHSGYNTDVGIQYLLTENIEVDAEYGRRISGQLGGFSNYYGVGGGIRF